MLRSISMQSFKTIAIENYILGGAILGRTPLPHQVFLDRVKD